MPSLQQSGNTADKSEKITFRLSLELKRALRVEAAKQDIPLEDLCGKLLRQGLDLPAASDSNEQAGDSGPKSRTA